MCPAPPDPPAEFGEFGAWVHELALAETETRVLALLAANGFPTDLTRAPSAAEVASRTSFAAIETDVDSTTTDLVAALAAARAALLAASASILAGAVTVAEVLRRLDLTVAGVLTIPGAFDVVADLQRTVRGLLGSLARRSIVRVIADAARARITPTRPDTVDAMLARADVAQVLDVQASRLAADTVTGTARSLRDVAHRVAAATGAGAPLASSTTARDVVPGPMEVAARFVDLVTADARDAGVPRALADSAHQAALAGNGVGRTAAMSAYERESVAQQTDPRSQTGRDSARDTSREDLPAEVTPPLGPDRDPERDSRRTHDVEGFVPEDGAYYLASELLDRSTCSPCAAVDGKEYATWAEALVDYPTGQYWLCEGGTRCRGVVVMVSARENPATLRTPYGQPLP